MFLFEFRPYSTNVVVSNIADFEQVCKLLKLNLESETNLIYFVNLKWLTDSNKSGSLCHICDKSYLIGSTRKVSQDLEQKSPNSKIVDNCNMAAEYECQRSTPLEHHNHEFTVGYFS